MRLEGKGVTGLKHQNIKNEERQKGGERQMEWEWRKNGEQVNCANLFHLSSAHSPRKLFYLYHPVLLSL